VVAELITGRFRFRTILILLCLGLLISTVFATDMTTKFRITPSNGFNNDTARAITSIISADGLGGSFGPTDGTGIGGIAVNLSDGTTFVNATGAITVSADGNTLTGGQFNLNGVANKSWNVVISNASFTATNTSLFVVQQADPIISTISPTTGGNNGVIVINDLAGTSFLSGAVVNITNLGSTVINATNLTVVSSTRVKCSIDLNGAPTGTYWVRITNPGLGSPTDYNSTTTGGFTITSGAPLPTAITPSSTVSGNPVVTITNLAGTGFQNGATITFTKAGQTDIAATGVTWVSASKLTGTVDFTGKTTGTWNVVVTNPDAQTGTIANGFNLMLQPSPTAPAGDSGDRSIGVGSTAATNVAMSGPAAPGQTVTLAFNQPVSASAPTAVSQIQVVPAQQISSIELVAQPATVGTALEVPNRQVVGYEKIELVGVNPSAISGAKISFDVTKAWLTAHNVAPEAISLMRYHDNAWGDLPTQLVQQSGDKYSYAGETTGFSYFAVTAKPSTASVVTTAVTPVSSVTGSPTLQTFGDLIGQASPTATPASGNVPQASPVPTVSPQQPATGSSGTSGNLPLLVTVVCVIIVIGLVLVWRWWQKKDTI